ncbi:PRC-barrel domain containing protein [Candidatus Thorarchaeota archaeon]|nr:MAG: PRC-barrel domain containing protein [Candidatus Thorarchaeota archaeon]
MSMKAERSICCKELMKTEVLDSKGNSVGKIGDLTFSFDRELKLSKFILSGSRWEELMESLHVKPDRDPVFDESIIDRIDDHVHLETTLEHLKTTLDEDAIPEHDIKYSTLQKMDIIDKDGQKIGHALDIDFDIDGTVSMIVGGGFIEEKLEAIGFKADVDIIVPGHTISSITNEIHLNVSKDDLETTMEDAMKSAKSIRAKETREVTRQVTKVRLFTQRPF